MTNPFEKQTVRDTWRKELSEMRPGDSMQVELYGKTRNQYQVLLWQLKQQRAERYQTKTDEIGQLWVKRIR